jgi:inositol hexakisphosphate/diphosphoinositol-pentakisphosphate kinase
MYDDESANKGDGGLLRLHSTYRHDLKCFTSDEGRCAKTAAAFLKGLLTLDGALAPILAIMVRNDEHTNLMLDDISEATKSKEKIKEALEKLILTDTDDMNDTWMEILGEEPTEMEQKLLKEIGNPMRRIETIYELITKIIDQLKKLLEEEGVD